jgi:hypothetical protein
MGWSGFGLGRESLWIVDWVWVWSRTGDRLRVVCAWSGTALGMFWGGGAWGIVFGWLWDVPGHSCNSGAPKNAQNYHPGTPREQHPRNPQTDKIIYILIVFVVLDNFEKNDLMEKRRLPTTTTFLNHVIPAHSGPCNSGFPVDHPQAIPRSTSEQPYPPVGPPRPQSAAPPLPQATNRSPWGYID